MPKILDEGPLVVVGDFNATQYSRLSVAHFAATAIRRAAAADMQPPGQTGNSRSPDSNRSGIVVARRRMPWNSAKVKVVVLTTKPFILDVELRPKRVVQPAPGW